MFKALIIVHLMIKEGRSTITLRFLAENPSKLAISNFSDVQIQGANIRSYYNYLLSRVKSYRNTQTDWARDGKGRLKRQTVEKGLLRETESVQKQIAALLKCDLFSTDTENEITLTAFRLLTVDLLALYHVMNEGTINVLEHYFEMSKVDAERALGIYKTFSRQTEEVVSFLSIARQYENATRLEIPKLKHAPTSLTNSLEEYLNDPDFEINRRQYLAQDDAKKGTRSKSTKKDPTDDFKKLNLNSASQSQSKPTQGTSRPAEAKGPAPDLIDFFESMEQNQQPMAAQPQTQIPNLQAVPQYQFSQPAPNTSLPSQQHFPVQAVQPRQQSNGQIDSSNPFASMLAQQENHNMTSQGAGPFGVQSPTQHFEASPMQNATSYQTTPFQQQASFPNGQVATPQSFPTGQPQSFSAPFSQQPFSTGQTQNSFGLQQPFSTGSSAPQSSNPFRQSIMPQSSMPTSTPFSSAAPSMPQQQNTNPFQRAATIQVPPQSQPASLRSPPPSSNTSVFTSQSIQSPSSFTSAASQPLQPTRTGTNPFARSSPAPMLPGSPPAAIAPQATGTNPFRQSAFVNQQTGQGWQAHQGTMGGLENMNTIPVFPRPMGQSQFSNQPSQQPWPS